VNIELKLPERSFRNRHLYSDYQLFTTESEYKIMPRKIE